MSRDLARTQGRADIVDHLEKTGDLLQTTQVPVVVCGEFKSGKSTLINALILRDLCPVDADLVTAVPTLVSYADVSEPSVAICTSEAGELGPRMPLRQESLDRLITERAATPAEAPARLVEIGVRHRMLASGLCLVDTPGVGGLDSAHGALTLGALTRARGLLMCSDASQELTAPELAFLQAALERCPLAALVVTKVDIFPQWRRIVELNRGHLDRAGLEVAILPVSSTVRRLASGRSGPAATELNIESGFRDLVTFIARDVVVRVRAEAAKTAEREVRFAADLLQERGDAERAVLTEPHKRAEVADALQERAARAGALARPTATWQETLRDGLEDLWSDVLDDLEQRLAGVRKDAEKIIEQGDPKQTWTDTQAWLRRQVAMVAVQNRELLTGRAAALAASVAEHFDLEAGVDVPISVTAADGSLESLTLAPTASLSMPGGRLAPLVLAARVSVSIPMVAGSIAAAVLGAWPAVTIAIAGAGIGLGAGVGHKIIRDERLRQQTYRQQQAKGAVHQFLVDVRSRLNKQTQDSLRATQRQLRDEFQSRAELLRRSALEAAHVVHRAEGLSGSARRRRLQELDSEQHRLDAVRAATRAPAGSRG